MTGTHGAVTYSVSNGQGIYLNWTDPYAGSNSYISAVDGMPYHGKILVTRSGGGGNNAVVVLTITNA